MKTQLRTNQIAVHAVQSFTKFAFRLCAVGLLLAGTTWSLSAASTWSGSANPDFNWSNTGNWDAAPAATGGSLIFSGATGLENTNDFVTSLGSSSFTFASDAGSFILRSSTGSALTIGNSAANDNIVTQGSPNNQQIALGLKLAGNGHDRTIVMSGGGSLTFNGNIDYANDWLFPTTTAGTIILNGNNTGDGKGSAVVGGTSSMRAAMRNNVANTQLVLGNARALGNTNVSVANLRGLIANQNLYVSANTDLTGANAVNSTFAINNSWIDCNGINNLEIGGLMVVAGNRDFKVTSSGSVTVSGQGVFLSNDQTARALYLNLSGAGTMTINGQIHDTFHSGGITTTTTDSAGNPTTSVLRVGTGTLNINSDNSSTFLGDFRIHNGGLARIGNSGALGAAGTGSGTDIDSGGTLDLNGQTIAENFYGLDGSGVGGIGALINSDTGTPAAITSDISNDGSFTVGGDGDITLTRVNSGGTQTVTKIGNGTLILAGTEHNNLYQWTVNAGALELAKSVAGKYAVDRTLTINGGLVKIIGTGGNQIANGTDVYVNGGIFDLDDKGEAIGGLNAAAAGGTVLNNGSGTATLYVGGSSGGTSSGDYAGVLQNGTGVLKFTKEGSGTQTLRGASTYTGNTTVSAGTLALADSATIANSPTVTVAGGATFDVSGLSSVFTLGSGQTLAGNGSVAGNVNVNGTLSPGTGIGSLTFNNNLALAGNTLIELNKDLSPAQSNDVVNVGGSLVYGGTLTVTNIGATALAAGDTFSIFPAGGTGSITVAGDAGSGLAFSFNTASGVLSVVSAGSPTLNYTNLGGGVLQFGWSGAYKLVWQTNALSTGLSNNWVDYPDASNPVKVTNNPAIPAAFFRLQSTP